MTRLGQCKFCEEYLEDITFSHTINGGVRAWLSHKEECGLYVCTSRDCKNCGVVIAIPYTPKGD
jgi:hypothetical protein